MKKIEDLFFTVTKILSSAQKFEQMHFFINCSKTKCGTRTAYFCLSSSWHFLCPADDIFEKSVEQLRFEQMHFQQLTLTRLIKQIQNSGLKLFVFYKRLSGRLLTNLYMNLVNLYDFTLPPCKNRNLNNFI